MNNSHAGYANMLRDAEDYPRAYHFLKTIVANLENKKLTDYEFREFCRNSLDAFPGLDYKRPTNTDPIQEK